MLPQIRRFRPGDLWPIKLDIYWLFGLSVTRWLASTIRLDSGPLICTYWTRVGLILEDVWCTCITEAHRNWEWKIILSLFRPGTRTQVLEIEAMDVHHLNHYAQVIILQQLNNKNKYWLVATKTQKARVGLNHPLMPRHLSVFLLVAFSWNKNK